MFEPRRARWLELPDTNTDIRGIVGVHRMACGPDGRQEGHLNAFREESMRLYSVALFD